MKILSEIAAEACRGWNERPMAEADLYRMCRRHRVRVTEMPLRTDGFYYRVLGRDFIAVDCRLPPMKKLFVLFHEFGHFLLHAPDTNATANFHGVGKRGRKEREADVFALCALIPAAWVIAYSTGESHLAEGLPREMVLNRIKIYETYGI